MRFLALGPLEAEGSGLRALSAAKHRALLAVMFINANRAVSVGCLIDELWELPPPSATNLVRQYVSRLRRSLGEQADAGIRLQTHAAGYTLVVNGPSSDVAEFERLVRHGHAQLAAGRPRETCEAVAAALHLWRGEAFADVPAGPTITAERARLEELRVGALELRARAQLKAGDFVEAVSELTSLILRYPLREGLYANLMCGLAATGRKAEALNVYRTARETLVTELGLEPSEELRQAEHAILADEQDPPSTGTPVGGPVTEPGASVRLPPGLTDFVGRQQQIVQLARHLAGPHGSGPARRFPAVAVLSGLAGAGKTALAVRLAHQLEPAFPDGQVFICLESEDGEPVSPNDALGRALEALGRGRDEQPPDFPARQHLYRRLLVDRRVLIVVDDAADEAQVRPLVPSRGQCAVLVTSRSRLAALDGAMHRPLQSFTCDEGMHLLALVAGDDRVNAEPTAARAIVGACGGLPLAVRAAAARLDNQPHRPLRHVAELLLGANALDELAVGDLNVRDTVAGSYSALSPAERRVLAGLPPSAVGRAAATPTVDDTLSEDQLAASPQSVDRLVEAGVLEPAGADGDGRTRFRCAELLRRYAYDRA